MIKLQKHEAKACARMEELNSKFGCGSLQIERNERKTVLLGSHYRQYEEGIEIAQETTWEDGMAGKIVLEILPSTQEDSLYFPGRVQDHCLRR